MDQQVEQWVEIGQERTVELKAIKLGERRDLFYEAAGAGIDMIRFADLRVKGFGAGNLPAPLRHFTGSAPGVTDVFPETVEIGGIREYPADPDNCD
ncbi:hypothetical protein OR1_04154 [Geobacter sp. OR-1]|nr:hypothetical protein OR1_04154 [Geobacter sp. OR-1]